MENNVKKPDIPIGDENLSLTARRKAAAAERRKEIVELINRVGFANARRQSNGLSAHYGIDIRNISRDFTWIREHVKPIDMEELKVTLHAGRDQVLNKALTILNDPTATREDQFKAMEILIKAGKHYREELEGWGIKEKVADKHNITGQIEPVQIVIVEPNDEKDTVPSDDQAE